MELVARAAPDGYTQLMFSNPAASMPHVRSGKLRAIAATSLKRLPELPELPTVRARRERTCAAPPQATRIAGNALFRALHSELFVPTRLRMTA